MMSPAALIGDADVLPAAGCASIEECAHRARKLWNAFCGCGWYHVSDDELNENQSS